MTDYLRYSGNKETIFYSRSNEKTKSNQRFKVPSFNYSKWNTYSDEYWAYMLFKEKDFPTQGWKIHITSDIDESPRLLYDVATYLIKHKVSFKYVPNLKALKRKNLKYADRTSSGKFITIYPENNQAFFKLLQALKEITEPYKLGAYILNDQQWQESNVFFRYGGLKRITTEIDGQEFLAIQNPDGSFVIDQRVPYYYLPDFVIEPNFIKERNVYPDKNIFDKLNNFNIIEAVHQSNAGGVYLAKKEQVKIIIKEGRDKAGIDSDGKDGFERNKNEYYALNRLKNVKGVVNVHEYFTVWRHNYFTEDYIEGRNLQKFIAQEYPFIDLKDGKKKSKDYLEKCIMIAEQLIRITEEIHKKGVAMGDLSLNNVLLTKNDTEVVLIDFEAATSPETIFNPTIATPGFISTEAKDFGEADWFALYRIIRTLLLPIVPVYDLAPQIIQIHNRSIENIFGKEAIRLIEHIERKISKHTNLYPQSPFLNQKLNIPIKELSAETLNNSINELIRGIINNLDLESVSLIKGNIEQYNTFLDRYNIAYGSFGTLLSLIRSDDGLYSSVRSQLDMWVKTTIPYLKEISKSKDIDFGLFTGLSGIVTTIYELGYEETAFTIFENILTTLTKDKIYKYIDLSFYSGLSGVGLFLLSFYNISGKETILQTASIIYDKLYSMYKDSNLNSSIDVGLLTGWTGVALFFWKYGRIIDCNRTKKLAVKLVDKAILPNSAWAQKSGELFVIDESRGFQRLIPYIENGSSGIALAMLEFYKEDPNYLNESRTTILHNFIKSSYLSCSANGGLISGYSGLIPLANAASSLLNNNNDMLNFLLENLNNYLIRNDNNETLFPGDYGFKCSMNVSKGAAGVLLVLSDIKNKDGGSWIPLPHKGSNLFKF
ncbi:hypothetical protein BW727_200002 (plasmid) [Jeotgalibaca dankookensis]|uniref:Protein kinase domain-containing protein n=2 Tax=Jeotgalibaca dankookensis TaxID=708126 RepID=A0A1S6IS75_9LACT|nr:hypothetical protein BW727_200002 [Jeotgalibaca dankookensis]